MLSPHADASKLSSTPRALPELTVLSLRICLPPRLGVSGGDLDGPAYDVSTALNRLGDDTGLTIGEPRGLSDPLGDTGYSPEIEVLILKADGRVLRGDCKGDDTVKS